MSKQLYRVEIMAYVAAESARLKRQANDNPDH